MKTHEENLQLYLQLGGIDKNVKLYRSPTLPNRAKLQGMVKKLEEKSKGILPPAPVPVVAPKEEEREPEAEQQTIVNSTPHHALLGFISDYPEELHASYKKAFESWLNACSLKLKLNRIPVQEEKQAYEIQREMYATMQDFDQAKKALDYYKENRSILPTEFKEDLTGKTDLELDRRLRSLRSQITRRAQTIASKTEELPPQDHPKYQARISALNKKTEELEVYRLEVREIERIIAERLKK